MTPERRERFREVALRRQRGLTVILENVHDDHNIGAVLRSCDAAGLRHIFVLHTEEGLRRKNVQLGKRTSAGARRWVDVHFYRDAPACFAHVRQECHFIFGTHLGTNSVSLHELDFTQNIALLFGNERDGLTEEVLSYCDGNFLIPMMGMTRSLNISVACAVTLYEAMRQRQVKGMYGENNPFPESERAALFEEYLRRHEDNEMPGRAHRVDE